MFIGKRKSSETDPIDFSSDSNDVSFNIMMFSFSVHTNQNSIDINTHLKKFIYDAHKRSSTFDVKTSQDDVKISLTSKFVTKNIKNYTRNLLLGRKFVSLFAIRRENSSTVMCS